ncbi:efflux RND transporter periplasmic adaptor subunit [Jatrophihabitans sp. DSM 45814]
MLSRLRAHPRLTGITVVIVLAGVGFGTYAGTRGGSATAATPTTTQTVSTATIKQSVSATGTLAPASQESLDFAVSGQVTGVSAAVGQTVKKGQILATVDSASLAASVAQAEATVANDQAKVDSDTSASATQLAADNAALTAANNQLTSARSQLAAANLTSPIDGVVATVNLSVGQSVSGTSSSSTGSSASGGSGQGASTAGQGSSAAGQGSSASSSSSPQVLVISTNSWVVNATVGATSVGLIKTADQAQLAVTGADGTVYGTISSIGLVSSSTTGTASYPVVIAVTGAPTGMHDGANVTATLIYKQLADVVVVSSTAVHRDSAGNQYVEQVENGKTVQTTVKVGLSSGGQTQILSGVSAGDKIVVPEVQFGGRTGGASTNQPGTGRVGTGGSGAGGSGAGGFGTGEFGGGGFGGGARGGATGGGSNG